MTGLWNIVEFLAAFGIPAAAGIWASRRVERARAQLGRWQP